MWEIDLPADEMVSSKIAPPASSSFISTEQMVKELPRFESAVKPRSQLVNEMGGNAALRAEQLQELSLVQQMAFGRGLVFKNAPAALVSPPFEFKTAADWPTVPRLLMDPTYVDPSLSNSKSKKGAKKGKKK